MLQICNPFFHPPVESSTETVSQCTTTTPAPIRKPFGDVCLLVITEPAYRRVMLTRIPSSFGVSRRLPDYINMSLIILIVASEYHRQSLFENKPCYLSFQVDLSLPYFLPRFIALNMRLLTLTVFLIGAIAVLAAPVEAGRGLYRILRK
jgi:hypothetical protein